MAELLRIKLFISAAECHKSLVASALRYPSVAYNGDLIGILDGGKTVGNNDCGPSAAKLIKSRLNKYLRCIVESAGGLVQNKYGRIL